MEAAIHPFDTDDGFFEDLEKAAKGLSVVTDRAATDDLRRLVERLHEDEPPPGAKASAKPAPGGPRR